jgi:hypothetical protein
MDKATIYENDRIVYLGNLMALMQVYLEFNLSVTDAILAAESDLVTWKTANAVCRLLPTQRRFFFPISLSSR